MTSWYQPRVLEGKQFDILGFVEGSKDYDGDEALRRSKPHHYHFARLRQPGDRWITPLVSRRSVSLRRAKKVETEIFFTLSSLVVTALARDFIVPVAGAGVEFLPVEVTDGTELYWVAAPIVAAAFNQERSFFTMMSGRLTSIDRPVLNADAIPADLGVMSISNRDLTPVLSQDVVNTIRKHKLYGIDLRQIEVV